MPIYQYECSACKTSKRLMITKDFDQPRPCEVCSQPMARQMGSPSAIERETVDEYRKKSRFSDTEQKRHERAQEHFRKVELPKIIETQGLEYAIRHGWVKPEDQPK